MKHKAGKGIVAPDTALVSHGDLQECPMFLSLSDP